MLYRSCEKHTSRLHVEKVLGAQQVVWELWERDAYIFALLVSLAETRDVKEVNVWQLRDKVMDKCNS